MHPNPAFRHDDPALLEALVDEIGFGMLFLTTPDGPRVAHTPLLATGDGAVQFHLARGNALAKYIDGAMALIVVNGPEGYVSPRFYADQTNVPTWNYISVELEGRVRRMDSNGLLGFLQAVSEKYEAQLGGEERWTMDRVPEPKMRKLLSGIIGFELEIQARRPTFKLSQNKSEEERNRVATGLHAAGSVALATLMRQLAP